MTPPRAREFARKSACSCAYRAELSCECRSHQREFAYAARQMTPAREPPRHRLSAANSVRPCDRCANPSANLVCASGRRESD